MTSRKYIIGSLIAVAAVIIAVVLWQGFPLKQTGADRMVNAVNSMYSNVVFHDSADTEAIEYQPLPARRISWEHTL